MTAQVHSFPLHRNHRFVQRLVQQVSSAGPDGTRDGMIETLSIEWDRLEGYGVECGEIERRLHELARELWLHADGPNDSAVRA